jgi:hypothetical protein
MLSFQMEKMPLILRAIITGFGYKIGAELGRYVATRIGLIEKEKAKADEPQEDVPDGITAVPPEDGDDEAERGDECADEGLPVAKAEPGPA